MQFIKPDRTQSFAILSELGLVQVFCTEHGMLLGGESTRALTARALTARASST
jgi:ABC-type phosphate/phosphonate transport system ATPase subunit